MGLMAGFLVTGCASPPQMSIEKQLSYKTLQWADALMGQDYDRALNFMTPSYQSGPRAERFRGEFSGSAYWQGAEIKWVKCDEKNNPIIVSDDDSAAIIGEPADNIKSNAASSENTDDCRVNVWEDCGQELVAPFSTSSTMSTRSDRCEARLVLFVMKPPEMSFPMTIPYEVTWLNVDGAWYIYQE